MALAAGARLALAPLFGEQLPFLTFFPAVAFAAWYGGFGPGVLATTCGAALATLLVPAHDPTALAGSAYWIGLTVFVSGNVMISALSERLHVARYAAAEAADTARRIDDRSRRLFQSNIMGIIFWKADGTVTDANDAFLALAAFERAELERGRINWRDLVVPDFMPLHVAALEQLRTRGECDPFDSALRRRDGTVVPIFCGAIAFDEHGTEGVTFVLDMSESRRTREALRESEKRYRTLFEDSPIALIEEDWSEVKRHLRTLARDGDPTALLAARPAAAWECFRKLRILDINRVALDLLGVRAPAELEADVLQFFALEPPDAAVDAIVALCVRGERVRVEQALVTPAGKRITTLIQMSPLPGHEDSVDRVLLSLVDITERKNVEAEREHLLAVAEAARRGAEEANRAKDEFLATVSHELRTPLSPILAWARMLRDGVLDADRARHAVEVIERSARTQAQLVEDLLDVSRIMAGKMRLDVRPVTLAAILERAVEVVRPSAEAKDIRLDTMIDSAAGAVLGDEGRLQQVVWNLLANAVKFTPRGGRVLLGLARVRSHLEIVVVDTGEGMLPEFVPHVFDRFRQADASTTRAQSGLGLGLAIVRHIVEAHGGSVRAESPGRGQGAVFTVTLPLMVTRTATEAPQRHATDGAAGDAALPRLDGVTVLVVDDEPDASEVVAELLAAHGAEVRQAHSAAAARTLLASWRPTLIVSDVGMPGEDGYAFITRWRAEAGDAARIPAVALTAYAGRTDKIRLLSAGFDAHVPKPLDPAELLTVLASLTRASRAI